VAARCNAATSKVTILSNAFIAPFDFRGVVVLHQLRQDGGRSATPTIVLVSNYISGR
jgi:hypothetical protein